MRVSDRGAFVRVYVSRQEVREFTDQWPGSNLPDRAVWFEFDKKNGDLVDMEPSDMDGEDAAALSQDAQEYAGL